MNDLLTFTKHWRTSQGGSQFHNFCYKKYLRETTEKELVAWKNKDFL